MLFAKGLLNMQPLPALALALVLGSLLALGLNMLDSPDSSDTAAEFLPQEEAE